MKKNIFLIGGLFIVAILSSGCSLTSSGNNGAVGYVMTDRVFNSAEEEERMKQILIHMQETKDARDRLNPDEYRYVMTQLAEEAKAIRENQGSSEEKNFLIHKASNELMKSGKYTAIIRNSNTQDFILAGGVDVTDDVASLVRKYREEIIAKKAKAEENTK